MKTLIIVLSIVVLSLAGCAGQQVKSDQPSTESVLKLKIEGVDTVKVAAVEESDRPERELCLKEKSLALEREKWEFEKKEKTRDLLKSKLSTYANFEFEYPTIDLYSTITMTDWRNIQKDLEVLKIEGYTTIVMRIFSGGGSAFAGLGIADSIKQWHDKGLNIIGKAYGIIASATVPIFASCSERYASPSTLFMVHEAAMFKFFTVEKHSDIIKQKEMLDKMQEKYVNLLASRSKKPAEFWLKLEKATTWFDVTEAVEWGLVDKIE
jgi:ATP-dependent protease ClpP protease subunit